MTDLDTIDGIGPAMAERLEENGYADLTALAEADQDELAEVKQVTSDKALDFIVQAQNAIGGDEDDEELDEDESFDLTPSEVSDELEDMEEEIEEASDEEEEPELEEESEPEPETYEVELTFDERLQFDVFHAALMRRHERIYTGNQPSADALQKCLSGLESMEKVAYELNEQEINELHSAILQQRTSYQGDNLIDHMDALKKLETSFNEQRDEYLF